MSATRSQRKRPTIAAERDQRDQERPERLEELHQQLTEQVEALVNGEQWQAMLRPAVATRRCCRRSKPTTGGRTATSSSASPTAVPGIPTSSASGSRGWQQRPVVRKAGGAS
jgi:hypothetical protein